MGAIRPYHEVEIHRYLLWPVLLPLLVRIVPGGNSSIGSVFLFKPGSFGVEIGTCEFMIEIKFHIGHLI